MKGIKESMMSSKTRYVDNRVFIGPENNRKCSRISEVVTLTTAKETNESSGTDARYH